MSAQGKFRKVLHEFAARKLHSGSHEGPVVTNPAQAQAIAFSEKRRWQRGERK